MDNTFVTAMLKLMPQILIFTEKWSGIKGLREQSLRPEKESAHCL